MDSGAFSELSQYGQWTTAEEDYINTVRTIMREIGGMDWAAPMDWMCEPWIVEKTGLSVAEHQYRTACNFLRLRSKAPELPFIPVLQGGSQGDYLAHVELYQTLGVDLLREATVGLGSVCRRQGAKEVQSIVTALAPLRLHGFGVKSQGLARMRERLVSADSMAWSFNARREAPLLGHPHKHCNNCWEYAKRWYEKLNRADRAHAKACGLPEFNTQLPLC